MSDERTPPTNAPHETWMTFSEFDWYCEFNARPGVTPLTIIDELYERGCLDRHQFLWYFTYVQRIYLDNISIVLDNHDDDQPCGMDDLIGHVEH